MRDERDNDDTPSLGERIRDFLSPALEDESRQEIQNRILNDIFEEVADGIEETLSARFEAVAQAVNARTAKRPSLRNPMILELLTRVNPKGDSHYSPQMRIGLPLSTAFALYSSDDVKEQPGYIRLHEIARELDIAIKVHGLTADESKSGGGFSVPPMLLIDASKSYEEGSLEGGNLYPDLPPRKGVFKKEDGREFKF